MWLKSIKYLSLLHIAAVIIGLGTCVYLYRDTLWLSESISELGTLQRSRTAFTVSVLAFSTIPLGYLMLAISYIYRRLPDGRSDTPAVILSAISFVVGHLMLALAGIFPQNEFQELHFLGGSGYFSLYGVGVYLFGHAVEKTFPDFSRFSRDLFVLSFGGGFLFGIVLESIIAAELYMITFMMIWTYVLLFRIVPLAAGDEASRQSSRKTISVENLRSLTLSDILSAIRAKRSG